MTGSADLSYRALLRTPAVGRVIVAMELNRTAQAMLPIVLVLYALNDYDSAPLAGLLTFLTIFPGLVVAPVVGALLDRFGRISLIRLDYIVTAMGSVVIAGAAISAPPPETFLIAVTFVLGVTQMFSDSGLRSLFPRMVPPEMWERVNAVDSTGYQLATIGGPPIAATVFVVFGAAAAMLVIGLMCAAAALVIWRTAEPEWARPEPVPIARSTWEGLAYVWRNRTLRGIAISVSLVNVCFGVTTILVPIILIDQLVAPDIVVGLAFALSGVFGVATALVLGRFDTRGRERALIIAADVGLTLTVALLYPSLTADLVIGTLWVLGAMALFGASTGAWDIGIFTVRQRRTDPRLMGRAFAISMALNQTGFPIGAVLGGWLARDSVPSAILVAVVFGVVGTALGYVMLPRDENDLPAGLVAVGAANDE